VKLVFCRDEAEVSEYRIDLDGSVCGATRDTAKRASENLLNRFGDDVQEFSVQTNRRPRHALSLTRYRQSRQGDVRWFRHQPDVHRCDGREAVAWHRGAESLQYGYLGVKTMVESLQGKTVEKRIDTGVTMITPII